MSEFFKKRPSETKDYKERFEFKLTVGDNIICQRYFRINNFNETCKLSNDLLSVLEECGRLIDNDLKDKTLVYLQYMAPKCFKDINEMKKYFENPKNKFAMHLGEGIVVGCGDNEKNFYWGDKFEPVEMNKFDKGEFTNPLTEDDYQTYKFAFIDNGSDWVNKPTETEVASTTWVGCYPRLIRNSIDLSNKKGKCDDPEEISKMSHDRYVLYKMVEGKTDNVWDIIKKICDVCSMPNSKAYDCDIYGYDNIKYMSEVKKYEESFNCKK